MGPQLRDYPMWLRAKVQRFDAVIHMTYMYGTTTTGLTITSGRVPTILQPTAHDEPAIWVRQYDTIFRLADAFMFFTPEERQIVADRFDFEPDGEVIGIGMEIHGPADPATFWRQYELGDDPYCCTSVGSTRRRERTRHSGSSRRTSSGTPDHSSSFSPAKLSSSSPSTTM